MSPVSPVAFPSSSWAVRRGGLQPIYMFSDIKLSLPQTPNQIILMASHTISDSAAVSDVIGPVLVALGELTTAVHVLTSRVDKIEYVHISRMKSAATSSVIE